jgi:hypothetical protein
MKKKLIIGIAALVLATGMTVIACSNPADSNGSSTPPPAAPALVFSSLDDDLALVELSLVSQTRSEAVRAVSPGNYTYTLKRNGETISAGTATVTSGGNAVFTSTGNKTWTAHITDKVEVSASIPLDNNSLVQPMTFHPDKTSSQLAAISIDGKWINPCPPAGASLYYTFSGNTFTHIATNYSQSGTFNRAPPATITLTATSGDNTGTWSQGYKLLEGDILFLMPDNVHNSGPFVKSSGIPTSFEGVWTNSGKATITIMDNVFWVNRIEAGYNGANWTDGLVVCTGSASSGSISFTGDIVVTVSVSSNTFTVTGMTGNFAFLNGTYTL